MKAERQVLFWMAVGLVFLVAVLALRQVLLPFVAGLVIAYAFNPLADRLEKLGLSRTISAALVVLLFFAIVAAIAVFLLPLLAAQIQQLVESLPGELERLRDIVETWARERLGNQFPDFKASLDRSVAELSTHWTSIAGVIAGSLWSQGRAVIEFVAVLLIAPVVVFYVLVDWNRMLRQIDDWLPRRYAPTLRKLAGEINDAISAFIRGQGLVCIILGLYYTIALSAAGLKYGLLVGLMTGILSFVPFVGWAAGLATSSTLALIQGWPDMTLLWLVLLVFAGSQALDAAFLSPKIVGSRVGLHPVWLIFALVVFSYLFGMVGVLVAVPLAAATGVLVRFALKVYLGSSYYTGEGGPAGEPAAGTMTAAVGGPPPARDAQP